MVFFPFVTILCLSIMFVNVLPTGGSGAYAFVSHCPELSVTVRLLMLLNVAWQPREMRASRGTAAHPIPYWHTDNVGAAGHLLELTDPAGVAGLMRL